MYSDFFSLRCKPFDDRADLQFFHPTRACEKTLAAMEYQSRCGKGMMLVLGAAGTGKTLLVRMLLQRLHTSDRAVVINRPEDGKFDLIRETCKRFGVTLPTVHSDKRGLARLRRGLIRLYKTGHRAILIIDQAENMTADELANLPALTGFQKGGDRLLTVILAARPGFRTMFDQVDSMSVRQQLRGERTLVPLTADETAEYVRHRLLVAGAANPDLFDPEAVELIHRAAGGVPQMINRVCDTAMAVACGAGEHRVDCEIATTVIEGDHPTERSMQVSDVRTEPVCRITAGKEETARKPERSSTTVAAGAHRGGGRVDIIPAPRIPDAVTGRMEDLISRGEGLAQRLERALAKADRMSGTSEASLLQSTAVEKHLASLTDNAGSVIEALGESAQGAGDSLHTIEERARGMLSDAEHQANLIETQLSRLSDVTGEVGERVDQVEQACDQADRVETSLTAFAEQLADKADTVQERVALLMSTLEATEEAHQRLRATLDDASTVNAEVDERTARAREGLEEAINLADQRRERFSDATLEQYEKKLLDRLASSDRSRRETIEKTEAKLQQTIEGIESRSRNAVSEITQRCEELSDNALREFRERLDRSLAESQTQVEHFEAAGMAVKETTGEAINQLRTQRDDLINEVQTAMTGIEERLGSAEQRQDDMNRTLPSITERIDRNGDSINELERAVERVGFIIESLEARANTAKTNIEDSVGRGEKLMLETTGACKQVEVLQREMAANLVELGGACERAGALAEQTAQCEQTAARLASSNTQNQRITEQLDTVVQSATDVRDEMQRLVVQADGKTNQLDSHNAAAQSVLHQLFDANKTAHELVDRVNESTVGAEEAVATAKEEAEKLHHDSRETIARTEIVIEKLTDQRTHVENVLESIQTSTPMAQEIVERLVHHIEEGDRLVGTVVESCGHADELEGRLESATAQGARIAQQLDATVPTGHVLIEKLTDQRTHVENVLESIQTSTPMAQEIVERLMHHIKEGDRLVETVVERCGHAGELDARLESATAQGTRIAQQLDATVQTGHVLIEKAADATSNTTSAAEAASERLKTITSEAREIVQAAESLVGKLADCHLKVEASTEPALETSRRLTGHMERSSKLAAEMAERCGQADQLVERLTSITRVMEEARDIEGSVKTAIDEMRTTRDELAVSVQNARAESSALSDLERTTEKLVQKHADIQTESRQGGERLKEQLTEQIASVESSAEAGRHLLAEFAGQAQGLATKLHELRVRADEISEAVNDATTRPVELVAAAQTQAAQLEHVCTAVRKVFGELSNASLEAKRHTDTFHTSSREATERLHRLTDETQRASGTLQEWIEEAVQVQGRLERTLERAPSIRQTHPSDALLAMSRAAHPPNRIANSSAGDELQMLSQPQGPPQRAETPVLTAQTRAEEVSQLIEDAKQTAAAAK